MGEGQCGMSYAKAGSNPGGAPMKLNRGPPARFADDLDLAPRHAVADSRTEGFGSGFLGGESGGKALGGIALPLAIGLFRGRIDTVEKPAAIAIHRLLDAPDFHQIDSGADNHSVYQPTSFCFCCVCGHSGSSLLWHCLRFSW